MEAVAVAAGFEFQSTHPCGVRRMPKGSDVGRPTGFNPRTPAGCDLSVIVALWTHTSFNPRTPAGCDLASGSRQAAPCRFNPRTPAGCDMFLGDGTGYYGVSIHAPLRGATDHCYGYHYFTCVSIHAPLRGATFKLHLPFSFHGRFNPRTPAGCDYFTPSVTSWFQSFNPRTPAGCDSPTTQRSMLAIMFQSTHPCGVRRKSGSSGGVTICVSIHAPLRGATYCFWAIWFSENSFQSTHPCGVRLFLCKLLNPFQIVSIHAPLRGAT